VINEYCRPCEVIQKGVRREAPALDGLERFSIDGVAYEAFHTSGGLSTLCETLDGRVNELNYKTIRYPGHHYLMDFLVNGMRMGDSADSRRQLAQMLERAIPTAHQDLVLIMCSAAGWREGVYAQETDVRKVYHQVIHGERWSAIQVTTASAACVAVDLFFQGKLPVRRGFVKQEQVELRDFLANRFGNYYSAASVSDVHEMGGKI
jgi:saccharopine dehydrogenase-like NADP-dependent oxidoreductase